MNIQYSINLKSTKPTKPELDNAEADVLYRISTLIRGGKTEGDTYVVIKGQEMKVQWTSEPNVGTEPTELSDQLEEAIEIIRNLVKPFEDQRRSEAWEGIDKGREFLKRNGQ